MKSRITNQAAAAPTAADATAVAPTTATALAVVAASTMDIVLDASMEGMEGEGETLGAEGTEAQVGDGGGMVSTTHAGWSKWDAVRQAFKKKTAIVVLGFVRHKNDVLRPCTELRRRVEAAVDEFQHHVKRGLNPLLIMTGGS